MRTQLFALHALRGVAVAAIVAGTVQVAQADGGTGTCSQEVRRTGSPNPTTFYFAPCNVNQECDATSHAKCYGHTSTYPAGFITCRCPDAVPTGVCLEGFKSNGGTITVNGIPYVTGSGACINYSCNSTPQCEEVWAHIPGSAPAQEKLNCPCP